MDQISNILGLIVVLAMVATLVGSKNTAKDVNALGGAFSGSIRAATGK